MAEQTVGLDPKNGEVPTWPVSLDGRNQDQMRERLQGIEPKARDRIFRTAAEILSQCPDPKGKGGSVTGLALGKVQSGKTSSFITLAAQAFDNSYRAVIVLAGTKTNLLRQNTGRIEEELADGREMELIVTSTERGSNTLHGQDVVQLVKVGRPVVITVLKHQKHIKQIADMFRHPDMANLPVLVIDDEGDQASLNTKRPSKRQRSEAGGEQPPKRSAINKAITDLRSVLKHHAFIAYTATPQANLLISTLDELSPQFCVLVEPGPGYTGGSVFHGANKDQYVRNVPDDESPSFEEEFHESLETALATFFVGAAVRRIKGDSDYHSMLVHTSHRTSDHGGMGTLVGARLKDWRERVSLPDGDPAKIDLMNQLKKGYDDLSKTVASLPDWIAVATRLPTELKDCKSWVVNSSDQGQIPDTKKLPFHNNIFIGGNMLDRGVTIPGLAVTFITRWAKQNQADTVEQRARWFGYKHKYLEVCRIWAPQTVLDGFAALLGHEDDLWNDLRQFQNTGKSVKEWKRLLRIDDASIKPTRSSVASFSDVTFEKDVLQQYTPAIDPTLASENLATVQRFFSKAGAQDQRFSNQTHKVALGVRRPEIQTELLDRLKQVDPEWSGESLQSLFGKLASEFPLNEFDVIWIENEGTGQPRTRSLNQGERLNGLQQGVAEGRESNPNLYPGDANLLKDRLLQGRAQLQVHTPKLKMANQVQHQVTALAFIIPGLGEASIRLVRGNG